MRWEGRRQSDNIEDRRGMRVSRGGLVGGGLGTLAIALLVMFLGGDPTEVLEGAGNAPVQTTNEPYVESPNEAEWRQFVAVTLASTENVWNEVFAKMSGSYSAPVLVLFSGAVNSTCGFAESAVGPFYCPADQKVYIDLGFFDQLASGLGAGGDFPRAYVVAHEVGHHVQNLIGVSGRVHELQKRPGMSQVEANALSVRLELQADCYAGLWTKRGEFAIGTLDPGDIEEGLRAASAIGDDALQRNAGRAVVPDSFTHGTSEQRQRWFMAGFDSGSVDACDTFKAADL
jgi:predicted metalloprotease